MRSRVILRSSIAVAAVAIGLAACQDRNAATITDTRVPIGPRVEQTTAGPIVTNQSDTGDGTCTDEFTGDGCTLREAIAYASSGATIRFAAYLSGSIPLTTANGQLVIDKNLSIVGPGRTHLTASATGTRTLRIDPGVTVTVDSLSFANGNTSLDGGVIFNAGTLTLRDCSVLGGSAWLRNGGGIANGGTDGDGPHTGAVLSLIRTLVASNTASEMGGGIYSYDGRVTVNQSTVNSNTSAAGGGGISFQVITPDSTTKVLTLINSTIAQNQSTAGGGIFLLNGLLRSSFSTIAQNYVNGASDMGGGGLFSFNSALAKTELRGNIIADNWRVSVRDDISQYLSVTPYVSLGGNFVQAAGPNLTLSDVFTASDDMIGYNPFLQPLTTDLTLQPVFPLPDSSMALNLTGCTDALNATVGVDERGTPRPQDGACDAGAYERVPTFSSGCTYVAGSNGRNTVTVWWRLADPGVTLVNITDGGRVAKKAMSPTTAATISLKTAGGTPTYDLYGGAKRGAMTNHLVASGTCTGS